MTETQNQGKKVSIFTKINYIFDKKQKGQLVLLAVLILIGGVFETLGVSMMLPVVSTILVPESLHEFIEAREWLSTIINTLGLTDDKKISCALLVVMIVLFVVKNAYLLFLIHRQNTFVARARNDMISRVMREFLNKPYEEYLGADIPTVFRITDSDIPRVFSLVLAFLQLATELVVSACLGIVLLYVNWQMTLLMLVVLLIMTVISVKGLKPKLNDIGRRNQETQSRIARWRIQAIYGLKDVKVLNRQDFYIRNYYESGKVGANIARDYAVLNSVPRLMIETVFMATVLLFILVYILRGGDAAQLVPQLTAFGVAAMRIMPSANRINTYITEIAYEQYSLDFVYENLTESMKTDKAMRAERAAIAGPELHLKDKIELRDITFAYPDAEKNIFTNANMVVKKGQSVGIMGPSGAGKSTIVDILLGLLHVQGGEIMCDGSNIFSNYDSWLAQIGYIPQAIYLVDETIRENIAFGIDEDKIDEKRIWEVMEEAQLADFVRSLPEGLDTTIGDRGVRLSGGQRQRIGIARALFEDPEVLVLDEATSALDNETEAAIMDSINRLHGKKTLIIIAHRLQTIEKCDMVYRVNGHKVTQQRLGEKLC